MNWGKWILVSFVLFALFIGTLVTVCVREDISLVAPDYYKQELAYQQQIERKQSTNDLAVLPQITVSNNKLTVSYPDFSKVAQGELKLIRPSDARLDQTFSLQPTTDTIQTFNISAPQHGMYKASISWSMGDKDYFMEETLYVN